MLTSDILSSWSRIVVVGDIHGDYVSFRKIHNLFDPRQDYLILLGDYADRGPNGLEVLEGVMHLVRNYPECVCALKGNHEDYSLDGRPNFTPCDLLFEVMAKRGHWNIYFNDVLQPFLENLPLSALIVDEVFFVHGGISSKIESLEDIKHPKPLISEDLLWSDPFNGTGERLNIRGAGVEFGSNVSEEICRRLGVKRIVRGNQPRSAMRGPHLQHRGRVITISSTNVYGGLPFMLSLPIPDLHRAFHNLHKYVHYLQ